MPLGKGRKRGIIAFGAFASTPLFFGTTEVLPSLPRLYFLCHLPNGKRRGLAQQNEMGRTRDSTLLKCAEDFSKQRGG